METKPKNFTVRFYDPADYPTVKEWWEGHGWPAVPEAVLPQPGIICELNGEPIAACWLYMSNSNGVAMMEWTVANPELAGRDTVRAIEVLTGYVDVFAKEHDYGMILTTCKQEGLARLLSRNGFQETDREMIHLIKIINK